MEPQKSFPEPGTAKIIIQHNKTSQMKQRWVQEAPTLQQLHIENAEGERFKFANNYFRL